MEEAHFLRVIIDKDLLIKVNFEFCIIPNWKTSANTTKVPTPSTCLQVVSYLSKEWGKEKSKGTKSKNIKLNVTRRVWIVQKTISKTWTEPSEETFQCEPNQGQLFWLFPSEEWLESMPDPFLHGESRVILCTLWLSYLYTIYRLLVLQYVQFIKKLCLREISSSINPLGLVAGKLWREELSLTI